MSDNQTKTREELEALSLKLQSERDRVRGELKAVNDEIAFRDNLAQRTKALEGLTPEQIDRVRALSVTVSGAGGVPSAEHVSKPGA